MSKSKSRQHSQTQAKSQPQAKPQSQSKEPPAKQKPARCTLIIVALALVIFGNLAMTIVYWVTRRQEPDASVLLIAMLLISAGSVLAGIAMWYWKRWGLYAYAGTAIASAIVYLLVTGDAIIVFSALLPAIIVAYILLPKMEYFD